MESKLNTRDEILFALVAYGFLSYHEGYSNIPKQEPMEKLQFVLMRKCMREIKKIIDRSHEILHATISCDKHRFADLLEYVHDQELSFLNYNDENSLSCVITPCYLYAHDYYEITPEGKGGKGYCDYLFLPKKTRHHTRT